VTFDDGWFDNLAYALPILDRHGVPALLFAATGYVGTTRCFWQERLGRMLHAAWQAGPAGTEICRSAGAETTPGSAERHARRSILAAVARCKRLQPAEIDTLLAGIAAQLTGLGKHAPGSCGDDRFLSWPELKALAEHPLITVGSHAVSHVPLPRMTTDAIAEELVQSRERLQDEIGRQVEWFAYPNGDHDSRSADLVRAAGYRGAFTTVDGPADPQQGAFTIQRVNVHEGATRTLSRFLCRTAGFF
jgi:peptidoglycan/xylan/chitin deacetylase (PgdA/CDA1 family)